MQYIIFGAGHTGRAAMWFLNPLRVAYFASNHKNSKTFEEKAVIPYDSVLKLMATGKYILVIASDNYYEEMETQVKASGIKCYFVFHESDAQGIIPVWPGYMLRCQYRLLTYVEIINFWKLYRFKKIAIYGDNAYLHNLISEVAIQAGMENIAGVVRTSRGDVYDLGIPELNIDDDDVWDDIDCLIVNRKRHEDKIFDILRIKEHKFKVFYMYQNKEIESSFYHPELQKYKDIHKGKRCFLLGNGPSLSFDDLNKLHDKGELTLACNRIYRSYNQTKWRADYLLFSDPKVIEICWKDLPDLQGEKFFTDLVFNEWKSEYFAPNLNFIHQTTEKFYPQWPDFSMDICTGTYWGQSVIYDLGLPLAMFMGFKEIYLLGVDCSYSGKSTDNKNHFIENYLDEDEKEELIKDMVVNDVSFKAYEAAKMYAEKHGIHIYNATRGGNLEVFERVNFDSLFSC